MHVAVGEREGAQVVGMAGGQHLSDGSAGVVGDKIDVSKAEALAQFGDDVGEGADRHALVGPGRALAVEGQIDSDAAAHVAQPADHTGPQVGIGADAVEEQRRRAATDLHIAEVCRWRADAVTIAVEARIEHCGLLLRRGVGNLL